MYTPLSDSMPPLVDQTPPFYPPPHGVADGGQPGLFSAFPGMRNNAQPSSAQWPPPGTPYPTAAWPISPPATAPAWSYNYPPAGTPLYAPQPSPGGWGTFSPGGSTGYPTTQQQQWPPPTPYFTGQPPPSTPYEPVVMTANPAGSWYDQQPQSAGAGGAGGYFVRRKKRRNSGYAYRDDDDGYDDGGDGAHPHFFGMKRTHSQNTPVRKHSLHRSASWGHAGVYGPDPSNGLTVPGYARPDMWNEDNLSRRPRDWRADFTGRDGIAGYLPSMLPAILKPRTDVLDWSDPERREVHPLLLYKPTQAPVQLDLRGFHRSPVIFPTLDRPHNEIDMAQLAFQPSAQFMRLVHPRLPWYVDVTPTHANGITVGNILEALMARLSVPIHGRHYWTEALSAGERKMISDAFAQRAAGRPEVISQGVCFVDFLGDRYVFLGLARTTKGLWEIKTTRG